MNQLASAKIISALLSAAVLTNSVNMKFSFLCSEKCKVGGCSRARFLIRNRLTSQKFSSSPHLCRIHPCPFRLNFFNVMRAWCPMETAWERRLVGKQSQCRFLFIVLARALPPKNVNSALHEVAEVAASYFAEHALQECPLFVTRRASETTFLYNWHLS